MQKCISFDIFISTNNLILQHLPPSPFPFPPLPPSPPSSQLHPTLLPPQRNTFQNCSWHMLYSEHANHYISSAFFHVIDAVWLVPVNYALSCKWEMTPRLNRERRAIAKTVMWPGARPIIGLKIAWIPLLMNTNDPRNHLRSRHQHCCLKYRKIRGNILSVASKSNWVTIEDIAISKLFLGIDPFVSFL